MKVVELSRAGSLPPIVVTLSRQQTNALATQVCGLQRALEDVYVSKIGGEQLALLQEQLPSIVVTLSRQQTNALATQVCGLQKALEDVYVSKIGGEQLALLQEQLQQQQALWLERQAQAQVGRAMEQNVHSVLQLSIEAMHALWLERQV